MDKKGPLWRLGCVPMGFMTELGGRGPGNVLVCGVPGSQPVFQEATVSPCPHTLRPPVTWVCTPIPGLLSHGLQQEAVFPAGFKAQFRNIP